MNIKDFADKALAASELLKMMGNERRLMILCQLGNGEKSVGELEKLVGLKQSALSQHLAKLRSQGLVETRRESQMIFYSLSSDEVQKLIHTLYGLYCPALEQ
ncbi:putative DNA-binding transcriptional regulator [Candidatus Terasakiella magnetica]|uniref:Putative DNA-binding transcriptional regulator n=1 Tax=Candidatus Terasakiella magnetica TaxID=1867952 RepID=A0A1C3RKK1_9PROT|nr:metalloregulator ArsR/SmtB family transcription factor [Candidatus Terasakiella magnetica]SCA57699.1 putative DNA-binding transcriptional regulator [Candidatus Terasakiella magnetica]